MPCVLNTTLQETEIYYEKKILQEDAIVVFEPGLQAFEAWEQTIAPTKKFQYMWALVVYIYCTIYA